ncbi:hypothetical protein APSETT444_002659 [Aspergillus pseudonomiae]
MSSPKARFLLNGCTSWSPSSNGSIQLLRLILQPNAKPCLGFYDAQDKIAELQGSEMGRVPDIVIGTPGRIWECIARGWLKTDAVTMLIFEGMDDILDRGYDESVLLEIFQRVAHDNTQVVVQSDSLHMWRRIWKLVSDFMPSPVRVWDI